MSWKTINYILGLAAVDQDFWQTLQKEPLAAIYALGFELTSEEQAAVSRITTEASLSEFSQYLLDTLTPDS